MPQHELGVQRVQSQVTPSATASSFTPQFPGQQSNGYGAASGTHSSSPGYVRAASTNAGGGGSTISAGSTNAGRATMFDKPDPLTRLVALLSRSKDGSTMDPAVRAGWQGR